ncbi:Protein commissureless [Lucilia cuprina]|uniref:Protein commissureless n=1 Tax=Lucilia cuprina TaxID=7375 RepID=A0A0L0CJK0_LUCCU|nr:Protein commissureless 1 [Lucilia cuprina]KNC32372.1 Protein commissureless [Lucilia cuprina]
MSLPITTLRPDYLETSTLTTPNLMADESQTASPTIMDMWMSQLQKDHPEISFVIPSQHDNQHIDNMMQFKQLLEQVGNTAYDTITAGSQHHETNVLIDSMGQTITHDQISNSAVLNMADVKNNALNGLERFFSGTDMHSLINYLWVGVVTSLIVLTVIFVLFSCYFYRKFREWKKCNKDIRAHLNNDLYAGGAAMPCVSAAAAAAANPEAAYYQMESPPCYTIATGLPTYDEALHHNQQHFAFGMKFIYPTLAAVHHQASNLISSWEKYDMNSKDQKTNATVATKCKSAQTNNNNKLSSVSTTPSYCSSSSCLTLEASTANSASAALLLPPSYDMAATMSLLSEPMTTGDNVSINMPQLETCATSAKTSSDLTDIITV